MDQLSRRDFLQQSGTVAAAASIFPALPAVASSTVETSPPPNPRRALHFAASPVSSRFLPSPGRQGESRFILPELFYMGVNPLTGRVSLADNEPVMRRTWESEFAIYQPSYEAGDAGVLYGPLVAFDEDGRSGVIVCSVAELPTWLVERLVMGLCEDCTIRSFDSGQKYTLALPRIGWARLAHCPPRRLPEGLRVSFVVLTFTEFRPSLAALRSDPHAQEILD